MSSDRLRARFAARVVPATRVPSWIAAARTGARDAVRTLQPPRLPADLDHVTVHYGPPSSKPPTYQRPHSRDGGPQSRSPRDERPPIEPLQSVLPSAPPPSRRENPAHHADVKQATEQLLRALDEAVRARVEFLVTTQRQMVELVGLIARRVIGREIALDRTVVHALAQEGIEALTVRDRLAIRVGSAFAERVDALTTEFAGYAAHVEVTCDASLDPYGCVVQGDLGSVDETVDARLGRLMQALTAVQAEGG